VIIVAVLNITAAHHQATCVTFSSQNQAASSYCTLGPPQHDGFLMSGMASFVTGLAMWSSHTFL
jgi:hypothetical protein